MNGSATVAQMSQEIDIDQIAASLPRRIHQAAGHRLAETPEHIALIDDAGAWSYGELDAHVRDVANQLVSLGVRAGDRMVIVSENCIALAALLLTVSRIDAWAIVANPRLSARELDQIRDHSGARRMFFTSEVSKEAAAHAQRYGAEVWRLGALMAIDVGPINEAAETEPVETGPEK